MGCAHSFFTLHNVNYRNKYLIYIFAAQRFSSFYNTTRIHMKYKIKIVIQLHLQMKSLFYNSTPKNLMKIYFNLLVNNNFEKLKNSKIKNA